MNAFWSILGALVFFAMVFGPMLIAIFRDPFYGSHPGPLGDWVASLADTRDDAVLVTASGE